MSDTTVDTTEATDTRSKALTFSARLALTFAIFLALAEIRRNWGDWGYWPFWVVDYIAVVLLLAGWRTVNSAPTPRGPGILCGAWVSPARCSTRASSRTCSTWASPITGLTIQCGSRS